MISSIIKRCIRIAKRVPERLNTKDHRKLRIVKKIPKLGVPRLVPSRPSRNKTSFITAKYYTCLILFDFFICSINFIRDCINPSRMTSSHRNYQRDLCNISLFQLDFLRITKKLAIIYAFAYLFSFFTMKLDS